MPDPPTPAGLASAEAGQLPQEPAPEPKADSGSKRPAFLGRVWEWLTYARAGFVLGVLATLASLAQFVVWALSGDPPSDFYLFLIIVLPVLALVLVLAHVTVEFRRQTETTARSFGEQFKSAAGAFGTELSELETAIKQLESHGNRQNQVVGLYKRSAVSAHDFATGLMRETRISIASGEVLLGRSELGDLLKNMCRSFAEILSSACQVECRVCIKEVRDDDDTGYPYVTTLCRNRGPADTSMSSGVVHIVHHNTAFNDILAGEKDYWISGDVRAEKTYKNTSPSYSYRSVLVWPVYARSLVDGDFTISIVAFLCADSVALNVFDEEAHVAAGWPMVGVISRAYEQHLKSSNNRESVKEGPGIV